MTSVRQQVRLFLEQYDRDGLQYMDCPECGKHNKLMVGPADEGGHWFKCLSVGCPTFGTTEANHSAKPKPAEAEPASGRKLYQPYRRDPRYEPPSSKDYLRYNSRYGVLNREVRRLLAGNFYRGADGSVDVLPVYGPEQEERGYVERNFNYDSGPKALLRPYRDIPEPMVSWYWPKLTRPNWPCLAIVEDQISAARLSRYFPTVALLGTSLDWHAQQEITRIAKNLRAPRICVILDNDAQNLCVGLAHKFPGRGIAIPVFHEDVKDMSPEDFNNLVGACRGG